MKKGDKIVLNNNVILTSQKTNKPLMSREGIIEEVLPKLSGKHSLQVYVIKVQNELFTVCSNEIKLK